MSRTAQGDPNMAYTITGLPVQEFRPLFGLSEAELGGRGVIRRTATAKPGFPCRVTLRDAEVGDTLLLLNHESHDVASPYRSSYAIYVNESAEETEQFENALPPVLLGRPIALRIFDSAGMLIAADLASDAGVDAAIRRAFQVEEAAYIHAHNAAHGCFAACIRRGCFGRGVQHIHSPVGLGCGWAADPGLRSPDRGQRRHGCEAAQAGCRAASRLPRPDRRCAR